MSRNLTRTVLQAAAMLALATTLAADGPIGDSTQQNCAWAKQQANDTRVDFGDLVVTAKYADYLYAEHTGRHMGIRVYTNDTRVKERDAIFVHGTVGTVGLERVVNAESVDIITPGWGDLRPMGLNNRALGGGPLGTQPNYQKGVVGGVGVNNIGLLIRTWGRVTERFPDDKFVIMGDGAGTPVKVECSLLSSVPEIGDYIGVTGISSIHSVGLRLVLPRRDSDVVVYGRAGG
jgi:hypothetical protein